MSTKILNIRKVCMYIYVCMVITYGVKLQTLFLYLFDVYSVCFISNQTIFKVKTEKPKTEKIRGIQGL